MLIVRHKLHDEVFGVIRHLTPNRTFVERKLANTDFLNDFIVVLSVKRRLSAQQNVCDHTNRPNIAFVRITFVQNFWRNIKRCSEHLIKRSISIKNSRSPKVNDLNLIKLLTLLQQDILWLQIPVHNIAQMTVVNT